MRTMSVVLALAALVLGSLDTVITAAHARTAKVVRQRIYVAAPVERPYWDSYIVPRYRYRPEDDRVDPYGPPVVPVIRLWNGGEIYLPRWGW